jgi:Ca2+:H+ antiporter
MLNRILYGMLIFVPIAAILEWVIHPDPLWIFIAAAIAIVPLAKLVGQGTEELALHTGPRIGGLLNATLGNAAELIITIFAIREGLIELVIASITGSIVGNLLLVMGLSLLVGGLKNGTQRFERKSAGLTAVLTFMAILVLAIPSTFDAAIRPDRVAELQLSEGVAIVMIVLYLLSVVYSFTAKERTAEGAVIESPKNHHAHKPKWSMGMSLGVLAIATVGIALMSEFLVGAVEPVTESLGLSEFFIGIILIPIIGNVAEHLVAVQVAYKNDMELSMTISLGSSLQIALFVAPVLVFVALLFGQQMFLVFTMFELIALLASGVIAVFVAQDGETNWFEGAMLIALYVILAIAFFFLPTGGEAVSLLPLP